MTDFAMCSGSEGDDWECPLRNKCRRYMSIPDETHQVYMMTIPWANDGCRYFLPMSNPLDKRRGKES